MPSTVIQTGPPTHPALHVRDAKDAHIVLEAVRLNMLPLIKRRLTVSEREKLVSGNVFVWEEAGNDGGLLRWTDGRRWSQSRMRGDYLFYEEKMELTQEEKDAKAARRARRTTNPLAAVPPTNRRKYRPNRPNGLTKQTYSALVYLPGSNHPRKWHVVAYFTGDDYVRLPVIESYEYLRSLCVPEGIFASSKANGTRNDRYCMTDSREGYSMVNFPAQLDLAHYSRYSMSHEVSPRSMSSLSLSPYSPPMPRHSHSPPAQSVPLRLHPRNTALPSFPALTNLHAHSELPFNLRAAYPVHLKDPSPSNYGPLSTEDKRVLDSFRVVL